MSDWRRCDSCRKVKRLDEYDPEASVCRTCLTQPAPRRKATAPVSRRVAPTAAPAPAQRRSVTGAVGSGDLEARERRAKRTAWEQLAQVHEEEYQQLLQAARRAEGLRT